MRFRELPPENPASQQPAAEDHQHDHGQEHGRVVDIVQQVVLVQVLQVDHGHRGVEVGHVGIFSHIGHRFFEVGLDVILQGVGHLTFEVGLWVNLKGVDHADNVQESCKHSLHSSCRFLPCKHLSILLSLTSSLAFGSLESQV